VYGLALQSDRQALPARVSLLGQSLMEATRVIEHGVGPDEALLPIPDLSSGFDKELDRLRQQIAEHDGQIGKDIRGRTMSRDFDDYLIALVRQAVGGDAAGLTPSAYYSEWTRRAGALQMYWNQAPYVEHNREVWPDFLKHNRLPDDRPHSQRVLDAEYALKSELGSNAPGPGWADRARELTQAYVAERGKLAESIKRDANTLFHSRKTSCPQPAPTGSGKERPAVQSPTHSVEEYYPPAARRLGLEGSVVLALRVDRTGCATAAAVVGSSGVDSLDQAALQFFETLTFLPAERGGQRIDSETPLKIAFALADLPGSAPETGPAPAANRELRR
jgi:TonB family protein